MGKLGTILVIDDNESILVSLKYVLGEEFERVITLNNPEKALTTLLQEPVDIVLLDMNFQLGVNTGNEGLMWLQAIKRKHPDVPVVLFTAYAEIDIAVKGLKLGASDFVVKPWDNEKLIMTLRMAIEKQNKILTLDEIEEEHIKKAIDKCHGNLSQAAEMLGVTRQTLYNKMKKK
ncbi:MAG: DNA-binding response regulator [Bacteroidaceae bacterium]|nr:DNA-binding response regulator [Bacteroidaceae bacterium]